MSSRTLIREPDRKTYFWKLLKCLVICMASILAFSMLMNWGESDPFKFMDLYFLCVMMIVIFPLIMEAEYTNWLLIGLGFVLIFTVIGKWIDSAWPAQVPLAFLWPFALAIYANQLRQQYGRKYCEADVDAIAMTLGLHWETQLRWKVFTGKRDEVIKQYRETHQCTWDEAYRVNDAIQQSTPLELKLQILKEFVQTKCANEIEPQQAFMQPESGIVLPNLS